MFFLLFLITWLLNIPATQAFRQAGYEIKDLSETELSLFEEEVKHWKTSAPVSDAKITMMPSTSKQKTQLLLGGPNILKTATRESGYPYYERIYRGLPEHKAVTIMGIFWLFDNELRDSVVTFGRISLGRDDGHYDSFLLSTVSKGNPFEKETEDSLYSLANDHFKLMSLHIDSTLTLRIESYIEHDSMRQSFGFRELTIHLKNSAPKNFETFGCHSSSVLSHSQCLCPFRTAPNKDNICQSCYPGCDACYGPGLSECMSCPLGKHWDGWNCISCHFSCLSCASPQDLCQICTPGYYDYRNGTCLDKCEWPYRIVPYGSSQWCLKPCKSNEYAWRTNETCLSECEFPLIKTLRGDGMPMCENPCSSEKDFLYLNGSCLSSCPAPLLAVFAPGVRYCKNPCNNESHYLYSNRSCLEECRAPLQVKSEPGVNYCLNPCSLGGLYLYPNGSCHSTCPLPLKTRVDSGVKYCFQPCNATSEYILPNGLCSSECPNPLMKRIEPSVGTYCSSPCPSKDYFISPNGSCLMDCPNYLETRIKHGIFKYCVNPCLDEEYYFYQNKSCLVRCPFPLIGRSEGGMLICNNPCSLSEFLYNDQTCYEECLLPFVRITEGGVDYCENPCLERDRYVSVDGNCIENCEYPYKIIKKGSYKMCLIDMSIAQALQIESTKHIVEISNTISEINGLLSSFIKAGDATSILVIPLVKMFEMVKYMKINFPAQVEAMLGEHNRRILSKTDIHNFILLGSFKDELLLFGILILVNLVLSCLFRNFTKRLKWNVLVPMFCNLSGEIALYFSFEFRNQTVIGHFLIGFIAILVPVGLLLKIQRVVRNNFEIEESWRFLFEIYKSDGKNFVFMHTLRAALFSLIICYMTDYPQIQALLIFVLSVVMTFYVVLKSPIENKFCFWQHTILESLLTFYNLLVLVLSILDGLGEKALEIRVIIGGIMNIEALGGPLITALLISFKMLQYMFSSYKKRNNQADRQDFMQINRAFEEQDHLDSRGELGSIEPDEDLLSSPSLETVITLNQGHSSPNKLNVNLSITNTDSGQIEVHIRRPSGSLIKVEEKVNENLEFEEGAWEAGE